MTPCEISFWGGALYGLAFMPPLPWTSFSCALRLALAVFGFSRLVVAQRSCARPQSAFIRGFAFGFAFIFVSLFGLYNAFKVVQRSLLFLPCLAFLASFWGSLLGGLFALQRVGLNRLHYRCEIFDRTNFLDRFANLIQRIKGQASMRTSVCYADNSLAFPAFALSFVLVWLLFEVIRSWLLFPFPWNLSAHLLGFEDSWPSLLLRPLVRPLGIYGLSVLLALGTFLGDQSKALRQWSLIVLGGVLLYGGGSLAHEVLFEKESSHKLHLLLVQPNIDQADKLKRGKEAAILSKTERLTRKALGQAEHTPDLIVWPESAVPVLMTAEDSPLLRRLQEILPDNARLTFGCDCLEDRQYMIWHNSLFVLSDQGIEATYDKARLLPFGEYVPFRRFFPKFFNNVLGGIDCTPGSSSKPLHVKGLPPFLPKICSETMFPIKVKEAQFILSVANDGWFAQPLLWQHLAVDRLRAVEARRPLIRTTNTGITAWIDAQGRVRKNLPLHKEGALEVTLHF